MPLYPLRIPAQLRQAYLGWSIDHDPVRVAKELRHAFLPITDSTVYLIVWRNLTLPKRPLPPLSRHHYAIYEVLDRPIFIPIYLIARHR